MTIANLRGASLVSTDVSAKASNKDSKSSASFSDVINLAGSKSADTKQAPVNKSQPDNKVSAKTDKQDTLKSTKDNTQSDNVSNKDSANRDEVTTKVSDSAKDGRDVKDTDYSVEDKDVTQGAMDEIKDIIDPIAMSIEQIMTLMVNVLNISEEDLSGTMKELNLVPEDLLDGENILKVVMTSNELSSTMDLLANEELAGKVKDLMNLINQTKEQLDVAEVTPEQAKAVLAEEVVVTDTNDEVEVETDDNTETEIVNDVKVTVSDERNADTDSDRPKEHQRDGRNQEVHDKQGNTVTQNVFTQLTQAVTQTTGTSYTSAQAVDIVNQIVEEIRAVVKADTTSMEIQLNPASLGKVHIQVASKEGVITAQITAQTEAAKNAIEGQIAVLRENFNNQGLKVEAVEVTINPEGFSEFNEQQAFEENDGKGDNSKAKKQINLDDLDLDEEELTEEEAINIDMMQRAGNSVDFTA